MAKPDNENTVSPIDSASAPIIERMQLSDAVQTLQTCAQLDPKQFASEEGVKSHPALKKFEEAASVVASAIILKRIQESQVDALDYGEESFSVMVWWELDADHFAQVKASYQSPSTDPSSRSIDALGIINETSPLNLWVITNDKRESGADFAHNRFMFGLDFPTTPEALRVVSMDVSWDYEPTEVLMRLGRKPTDIRYEQVEYHPNRYPKEDEQHNEDEQYKYRLVHGITFEDSRYDDEYYSQPDGWSTLVRGMRDASSYLLSGLGILSQEKQLPRPSVVEGTITTHDTQTQSQ